MRICIVGYGNMGKLVEREALSRGHSIVSRIDPSAHEASHPNVSSSSLNGADIVIDFSLPTAALENIRQYASLKVPAVIGVTGWYDSLPLVSKLVIESKTKMIWASNFAIGVHIFMQLVAQASRKFAELESYDVWGYEIHHAGKADSPSGTAKTLAKIITENCPRKREAVFDKLDRKPRPDELHFASVRGGTHNFEHTVAFDSAHDTLTLRHASRDRGAYASGALDAASWLLNQPAGIYGIEDLVKL